MQQPDPQSSSTPTNLPQSSTPTPIPIPKQIYQIYTDLQKSVDNMDRKVELIMQKHESQFLYAYRTHIHKIKRELQEIKKKSEEQEKLFSSNDRIRYLEKEVHVFREEIIKLYEMVERKGLEIQRGQVRIAQAEAVARKMEAENKELALQIKMLASNEVGYLRKISQLQSSLQSTTQKLQKLHQKLSSQRSHHLLSSTRTRDQASSLAKSRQSSPHQFKTYKNQMQQWFLQCVRTVKKEIQQRKNNFDYVDLNKITDLGEFRLVDKLRLFQLILENQKLLNWLYHRIFPDRMDRIGQYLAHTQSMPVSNTDIKTDQIQTPRQRYGSMQQNFQLPKVQSRKLRNSNIRNQVTIKNGKMSISIL